MSSRRQKKQRQPQQQNDALPPPELAAFSLAAAIQEARTSTTPAKEQQQQSSSSISKLPFFNKFPSSPLKKKNPSQASLATNTSFATANEACLRTSSEQIITPSATSYFVDSSDEETQESLTFGNDPLSVLSRTQDIKPTEISFVENNNTTNPEETISTTMAKKKTSKITPPVTAATTAAVDTTPAPEATPPTEESAIVEKTTTVNGAHFDVAQNIYGCTKNIWAWGKTIPVLSNVLGLTEGATAKVLDMTVHMDLPSIDQDVVVPHCKKLDDIVITPAICKIWGIISPAVVKSEEMIVKPVMTEVVPRILGPLGLLEKEEEKKNVIDKSDNPEVVPVALN